MNSETLNRKIAELDGDERFSVEGLENSGKVIPYIGWFWRTVDFTRPIWLGYTDVWAPDYPTFVGFMENNKWGYPSFKCTLPQTQRIQELLIEAVEKPSNETLQATFDYIQSTKPNKLP